MFGWEAPELGLFKSLGGILNILASFVVLPAVVIKLGERRSAVLFMCIGFSGFVIMGFTGFTPLSADGSDADASDHWFRLGCMVLGYPL